MGYFTVQFPLIVEKWIISFLNRWYKLKLLIIGIDFKFVKYF